ncbi:MAG: hypothetical protein BroJett018_08260 [Chloroflexota bacterium]|nr:TIR domain-containing protein [Chloroflexota bacterium]NOG62760.1 TIR domain-containing protein [Chloroflexota bacterium]GIK63032.1 MAG: hypothetical protein BroJett018_08260 [Chloroflexota bacterium]
MMPTSPRVFISHTTRDRRDRRLAHDLAQGLRDLDVDVWIAPESIPAGAQWETEIVSGIMQQCTHFLVILSPLSVNSEWVLKEIQLAQSRFESEPSFKILPLVVAQLDNYDGQAFISQFQELPYYRSANRQLQAVAVALGLQNLPDKDERSVQAIVLNYVTNLIQEPDFADWTQQPYFELQVNSNPSYDIRVRLRTISEGGTQTPHQKFSVEQAVKHYRRMVLIGEPGSGKTTALKQLALRFARGFIAAYPASTHEPVPIFVWLPHFTAIDGRSSYERILGLLEDAAQRHGAEIRLDDFEQLLAQYSLVLLLDGLNELGEQHLIQFLDGLRVFVRQHPNHLILISSRAYNFQMGGTSWPVFELMELTYPHDVEAYLACYLEKESERQSLLQILAENLQIRQLAVNPLLLLMMIMVYQHASGRFPFSRGQLLARLARGLLGEWELPTTEDVQRQYWLEDKHRLSEHLGYAMKAEGLELPIQRVREIFQSATAADPQHFASSNAKRPPHYKLINPNDLTPVVAELLRDRVLVSVSTPDTIRFWHQTLQEYFAAAFLLQQSWSVFDHDAARYVSPATRKTARQTLEKHIADSHWHEIIAIMSGLVQDQADDNQPATRRQEVSRFVDEVWRQDKQLGALCLSNIEGFPTQQMDRYVAPLHQSIYRWGIVLPRLLPWLLLMLMLTIVWLSPLGILEQWVSSNETTALGLGIMVLLGGAATVLFFRLYALTIPRIERFINLQIIQPNIAALRHIRNETAERILAQLSGQIAYDFSIGELTRTTIENGLVLPVRDESELILMLRAENTRLQASQALADRGSPQAIEPLRAMLIDRDLAEVEYRSVIRALVHIIKLQPTNSFQRIEIVSQLRSILGDYQMDIGKRQGAYHGLLDLGITDAIPPERDMWATVERLINPQRTHRPEIVIFMLIILVIIIGSVYFLTR